MKFVCDPNMPLHLNGDLKAKSGLRELILSKSRFWRREEKRENRARAKEGSSFGWDFSHFLLLRDQATYKRRFEEI